MQNMLKSLKQLHALFTLRGPGIHSDKGEHDVERDGLEGTNKIHKCCWTSTLFELPAKRTIHFFEVVLTMDMDVATDLGADARGAGMIAKSERELILTKPSAYTTWKAKQVTFWLIQFEFGAKTRKNCFRRRFAWSTFSTAPRPTSGSTPASPPSPARSTPPTKRSSRAPRCEFLSFFL